MCKANSALKTKPISDFYKGLSDNYIQYVGIAADETKRLERLENTNKVSLLAKYGYTEKMAYDLCKKFGLLSPMYRFTKRGGCWFCPNSERAFYGYVKAKHPELWEELRILSLSDNLLSPYFRYDKTFEKIDEAVDIWLKKNGDKL